MDSTAKSQPKCRAKSKYMPLFVLTQVIGLAFLFGLFHLTRKHFGGFGFSTPALIFNFHPVFMVIGFIILYSNSMLVYRTFAHQSQAQMMPLHSFVNVLAIITSGVGGVAGYYFHAQAGIPHFYSLHSWLGLATWALFVGSHVSSVAIFFYEGTPAWVRQLVLPWHRFLGVAIFVLAGAACLTGLNEKAIFAFNGVGASPKYVDLPAGGVLVNGLAFVLVIFVALVVFLATKPQFTRTTQNIVKSE